MNPNPRTRRARAALAAVPLALSLMATVSPASAGAADAHTIAATPEEAALPVIGIRSEDLEFMLQAARMCNGRIAAARLVIDRSRDHAAREFAQDMLVDYQQLRGRLQELAHGRNIALPLEPTRKMDNIAIALRGVQGEQVDESFFRRVGIDAEADAANLFAAEAADAQAWPALRALARSAWPLAHRRIRLATALLAAREDGTAPDSAAMLIPTPG
jgi:predicted outer membrane protein